MKRLLTLFLLLLPCLLLEAQKTVPVQRGVVSRPGFGTGDNGNTFMLVIDDSGRKIRGKADAKQKPDYIQVSNFSQVSARPLDEETGELKAAEHRSVKVVKQCDEASPYLMEALDLGLKLQRVELVVFGKDKEGEEFEQYKIRLDGVTILSINTSIGAGNSRMPGSGSLKEELKLSYDKISWSANDGVSSYHTDANP
jgi:type VI secretion system Hcp family effector